MARKAPKIALSKEQKKTLRVIVTRHASKQREVVRAKIILLSDQEKENQQIAKEIGLTQEIVGNRKVGIVAVKGAQFSHCINLH